MIFHINKCPCCQAKPLNFWKKSTTGIFRRNYCQHCNCQLKLNKLIAIPMIFLQWISLPLGGFFALDIFGFILDMFPNASILSFIAIQTLGIILFGFITTILYYILVPWNKVQ